MADITYDPITNELVPANLAWLGVKRRGNGRAADLETIWKTPYPVITRYEIWCELAGLNKYGGGKRLDQGDNYNVAGYITSGYRSGIIEGRLHSPHLCALAIDVAVGDIEHQIRAAKYAKPLFSRIGLYPDNGFIHLDLAPVSWIKRHKGKRYWFKKDGLYYSFDRYDNMILALTGE